jgi:DNA invertase Pin-like site-specific DNA recombinase
MLYSPDILLDFHALAFPPAPLWSQTLEDLSSGRYQGFAVKTLAALCLNTEDLQHFIAMLQANQMHFLVTEQALDTRRQGYGPLLASIRALYENDRRYHGARTRAGMQVAKEQGRPGGRPPYLDPAKAERARQLLKANRTDHYIRKRVKISFDALRRLKAEMGVTRS